MKYIFLRDDDVFSFQEPSFRWFWKIAESMDIPVMYAVIPGKLDEDTAKVLLDKKRASPSKIDIAQHGYMHINHNPDIYPKYEFGPSRSKGAQKRDLLEGMKIMELSFGPDLPRIFVPPFDGFDIVTLEVAEELGIEIFSADSYIIGQKYKFLNLPYRFAINDYAEDGTPIPVSFETMLKRYRLYYLSNYKVIGILLHHQAYQDPSSRRDLALFLKFLVKEETKGAIKLITASKLLQYKR